MLELILLLVGVLVVSVVAAAGLATGTVLDDVVAPQDRPVERVDHLHVLRADQLPGGARLGADHEAAGGPGPGATRTETTPSTPWTGT